MKLLNEREKTHGPYIHQSSMAQELKWVMSHGINWDGLLDTQKEALDLIASKLARILQGDADVIDHWDDIAGYAALVSRELKDEHASEPEQADTTSGAKLGKVQKSKGTGKRRKKSS